MYINMYIINICRVDMYIFVRNVCITWFMHNVHLSFKLLTTNKQRTPQRGKTYKVQKWDKPTYHAQSLQSTCMYYI